jgi:hypothetical protein
LTVFVIPEFSFVVQFIVVSAPHCPTISHAVYEILRITIEIFHAARPPATWVGSGSA